MAAPPNPRWDVVVVGGGNAALCAALSAAEAGARVLMLESAPEPWRGGNSVHTRNIRCMHEAPEDVLTDAYTEEEFWHARWYAHRPSAAPGCGATACISSPRSRVLCICPVPTLFLWVVEKRWSTPITAAQRVWA